MPGKNWRGKRHPGLIWRVLFGNNGPTRAQIRAELERKLRLSLSSDFVVPTRDSTGRVRNQKWRIEPDGKVREVKTPAKKRPAAAKKTTGRRTASQPSRASKGGTTPKRSTASTATPTRHRGKPEPLADRVLRNPDGTLNGSRPADPVKQLREARQAYLKASQRAEQLLGWDQDLRQR